MGYDRHPAVHHLDLQIAAGQLLAVVGPNGAGKSTLLKALAGVVPPMGGRIERHPAQARVAYLPQQADIDRSFPISVLDTVAMGLWHETGPWGRLGAARVQRCRDALAEVGLAGFEARTLDTLSGGQFQRVLFARLMLQDAALILLDEPLAAVDAPTSRQLLALIQAWHRQGRTVIVVLHDLEVVREHMPHTLLLAREPIAHGATAQVLVPALLQRAARLVEAFDEDAAPCEAPGLAADAAPATLAPASWALQGGGHGHGHGHAHAPGHAHGHRH